MGGLRMKKYVMLFTFTFLIVAGVVIAGAFSRHSIIAVNAVKVEPLTVENAVTCIGRVEHAETTCVYVPMASVVKNIYVDSGKQVKAGQPLFSICAIENNSDSSTVNQAQSYENLMNNYQQSNSSLPSTSGFTVKDQDITAPTAGEITSIAIERQGYAYPNKAVMVIASNSRLQVRLSVNESQISDIKIGQKAVITGVGFKNSTYSGVVKTISSDAKQVETTAGQDTVIDVIVSVDNVNDDIKSGFSAKTKIITSKNSNILIAPYEAVRADNSGNEYVYKLNGTKAVKTNITTNREFDNGFEIKSGLNIHDKIVLNPDNISDGAFVFPTVTGMVQAHD